MGFTIPRLIIEIKDQVQQVDHNGAKLEDTGTKRALKSKAAKSNKKIKLLPVPAVVSAWEPVQHPQSLSIHPSSSPLNSKHTDCPPVVTHTRVPDLVDHKSAIPSIEPPLIQLAIF